MPKSKEELRAQALIKMRTARANLGEDTIQKFSENVAQLERRQAVMDAAKQRIESEMDAERAAIEILGLLKGED